MLKKSPDKGNIHLSWVRTGERRAAIAYTQNASGIIYWITDYSIYLSDTQALNAKTVENEIFHLKSFIEYLALKSISLDKVDNLVLLDFRDTEYLRVKKAANSSKSDKSAQRTVNAKLRRVYMFLLWAQSVEFICQNIIGPQGFPVTSALTTNSAIYSKKIGGRKSIFREESSFPLLFRNAGHKSRHGTQYEATEEDIERLTSYFYRTYSAYTAQRNILMMELASQVSWRRGSINSLTCDQFIKVLSDDIEEDELVVIPPSQKFGYERAFEVPFRLAFRVAEFIQKTRQDMMNLKGWSEKKAQNRIFLSERTGAPLNDSSISMLFGKAFSTLGRPRGANIHSFRRKFANDLIEKEILARLELGLDTGALSIATSVALKMGHSNPESLMPYISSRISKMTTRRECTRDDYFRSLKAENKALKEELAELRMNGSIAFK